MVIPGVLRGRLVSPRVTKWPLGCQKCPFSKSLVLLSKTTHLELVGASGGHASRTRRQLNAFKGPLGCLGRPQGGTNEVLWQAIKCPTGPKNTKFMAPEGSPELPQETLRCVQKPTQNQNVKPLELFVVFKENQLF